MTMLKQVVEHYVRAKQDGAGVTKADIDLVAGAVTATIFEEVKGQIAFDQEKELIARAEEEAKQIIKRAQEDAKEHMRETRERAKKEENRLKTSRVRKLVIEAIFLAIGTGIIGDRIAYLVPQSVASACFIIIALLLVCILYVLSQTKE